MKGRERQRPGEPTLSEVISDHTEARLRDLHTAMPGRVKSYNAAKQTADVIPSVRGFYLADQEPTFEELPVIPNVPIAWMRGGGYSLQLPLAEGDHVILIFCESDISRWRTSGQLASPGDLRRHDLSYPFAIPAIAPDTSPLADTGGAAVLDGPGVIRMGGVGADFVAIASKVQSYLTQLETDLTSAFAEITVAGGNAAVVAAFALNATTRAARATAIPTTKLKGE